MGRGDRLGMDGSERLPSTLDGALGRANSAELKRERLRAEDPPKFAAIEAREARAADLESVFRAADAPAS